jgi:hypothetical protein
MVWEVRKSRKKCAGRLGVTNKISKNNSYLEV